MVVALPKNNELKNSEILFIYEAKLTNPNGDPDEENRPRIDPKTWRNLVTDVRLKRYVRDYIIHKFGEKYVWVSTVSGRNVPSDERGWSLIDQWKGDERVKGLSKKEPKEWLPLIPRFCIDARLFGATVAIRARGNGKGASRNFIGPVQFTWGFSLHPVELVESSTITSIFVGREPGEEERYGTMGKDWRLYYSLIAFYGVVSGRRGERTGLRDVDVKALDNIMWDAVRLESITRSKIGQLPHLYMRVECNDSETLIGDLRRFVAVSYREPIRDVADIELDSSRLVSELEKIADRINAIYIRESGELIWSNCGTLAEALEKSDKLKDKVIRIPHEISLKDILVA